MENKFPFYVIWSFFRLSDETFLYRKLTPNSILKFTLARSSFSLSNKKEWNLKQLNRYSLEPRGLTRPCINFFSFICFDNNFFNALESLGSRIFRQENFLLGSRQYQEGSHTRENTAAVKDRATWGRLCTCWCIYTYTNLFYLHRLKTERDRWWWIWTFIFFPVIKDDSE